MCTTDEALPDVTLCVRITVNGRQETYPLRSDRPVDIDPLEIITMFKQVVDMTKIHDLNTGYSLDIPKVTYTTKNKIKRRKGSVDEPGKPIAHTGNVAIYKERIIDMWKMFGTNSFTSADVKEYLLSHYGDKIKATTAANKQCAYVQYMVDPRVGIILVNGVLGKTKLYKFKGYPFPEDY